MIHGRDSQPDILSRTPLHRELRIAEHQADLLRRQILQNFEHIRREPQDRDSFGEWNISAWKSMNEARRRAWQLRSLIDQQRLHDNLFAQAAE